MNRLTYTLAAIVALCVIQVAGAGQYNKQLSIGDAAPPWKDLEGTDGKKHSLADLQDKQIVVVCFTCNTCPYAVDYEDRLIALSKKFATDRNKCALVCINSNLVKDDLLPAMQDRAKAKGFNFAYLHDAKQEVAKSFGAARTPEFVVLNKERKVIYLGAMDDSPDGKKITRRYVEDAVGAGLTGRLAETKETAPIGCLVRYVKERK